MTEEEDVSPKTALSVEEVEELAWGQIQELVSAINPYEFQDLVADLLKAMGYFIYWVAPPGKDGEIDIIAYNDPLGAVGPRVKVQVKHKIGQSIPVEPLRAFMSVIGVDEIGLFVSSGGFTSNAREESRSQEKRKITLIDLESLMELWIEFYPKLSQEARQRLPLKPIYSQRQQIKNPHLTPLPSKKTPLRGSLCYLPLSSRLTSAAMSAGSVSGVKVSRKFPWRSMT